MSSLFLVYWYDPGRVLWTKDGTVAAVHEYSDSMSGTSWNVLVYIYQHNEMGFLVNSGYVALNGMAFRVMETIAGTTEMVTALFPP